VDLRDPSSPQDASTKNYTDTADNLKAGNTMSGVLNMNNNVAVEMLCSRAYRQHHFASEVK